MEERGLSAAAFLNSHFHSLRVSNEVHWDSDLVTLVPAVSLQSSLPPGSASSFQSTPENDTYTCLTILILSDSVLMILMILFLIVSPSCCTS